MFHLINAPILAAENRGFRYGDGLFESMRMINGKLQFADLHAGRMADGMKILKIEGHNLLDAYFLKQKTADLAKKNKWTGNARFRLSIFRAGAGFYTPESNKYGYVLQGNPLDSNTYELNKKGIILDIFKDLEKPINKLAPLKTANSLIYVLAGIYKTQSKLDEAIILNEKGFICETISSNIFIVYQKEIYTPALTEGCVAGVMRSIVLSLAKTNNIKIIEAEINYKVLEQAEEVFITNAARGIQWVMGYGKKRYFDSTTKLLSDKLNATLK